MLLQNIYPLRRGAVAQDAAWDMQALLKGLAWNGRQHTLRHLDLCCRWSQDDVPGCHIQPGLPLSITDNRESVNESRLCDVSIENRIHKLKKYIFYINIGRLSSKIIHKHIRQLIKSRKSSLIYKTTSENADEVKYKYKHG